MRRWAMRVSVATLALGLPCGLAAQAGPVELREYSVYETLLRQSLIAPGTGPVLVLSSTGALQLPDSADPIIGQLRANGAPPELWQAFLRRNSGSMVLEPALLTLAGRQIIMVAADSLDRSLREHPGPVWDDLRRAYGPTVRIVSLSRVAFDESGEMALVLVDTYCGQDCMTATYGVLARLTEGWEVRGLLGRARTSAD